MRPDRHWSAIEPPPPQQGSSRDQWGQTPQCLFPAEEVLMQTASSTALCNLGPLQRKHWRKSPRTRLSALLQPSLWLHPSPYSEPIFRSCTPHSRNRSCFCSIICFKPFRSRARRVKVPNSLRKTSSYQLPTAWCANTPATQASTKNSSEDITSISSGSHQQEECWGETAHAAEPFISRNGSERVCFRGLTSACNGQQRHGTETWQPGLRTISLPDETKLEKSNFIVYFFST